MPFRSLVLLLPLILFLAACTDGPEPADGEAADTLATLTPDAELDTTVTPMSMAGETAAPDAVADLRPTEGNDVRGRVTFSTTTEGVLVTAEVSGLSEGMHGFHIHETGDCSAPDASSAGDHFNPTGAPHGAPDDPAPQRHAGDLGNIEAGPDGAARHEHTDAHIQLSGPASIIGRAVVVHAGRDDLTSQPSGDAGGRVACGVIEAMDG